MNLIRLASLALSLTTPTLLAQEAGSAPTQPTAATPAASTINPAAKKFLDDHKAVNATLDDLSCDATVEFGGELAEAGVTEEMGGKAHLSFLIKRDAAGVPFDSFHVQIKDSDDNVKEEWAGSPTQLQRFDFKAKKLLTMKKDDAAGNVPPMSAFQFFPQWIFERAGMAPETELKSAEFLADADIGGVKCRVVKVVETAKFPNLYEADEDAPAPEDNTAAPEMRITTTRWIGVEDKVLRKFHAEYRMEGLPEAADQSSTSTAEYTNVQFNKGLTPEALALTLPEGFTAEEGNPDTMGLAEAPQLKFEAGDDAPAFTLKDTNGAEVTLASLKGRVVLLDFWATWCGPCKAAMPGIQKLHEQFKDKPVTIIGVNTREYSDTAAAAYMKKNNYTYTCLLKGDDLATEYGISGIPTFVLIDANGKIIEITVGFDPSAEDALAAKIEEQLKPK